MTNPSRQLALKSCQHDIAGATGVASDGLGWMLMELSMDWNLASPKQGNSPIDSLQEVN